MAELKAGFGTQVERVGAGLEVAALPRAGLPEFKLLPEPIFTRNNSPWMLAGNDVMYWPCLVNLKKVFPGSAFNWGLYYSTDHATGPGGIGMATAPHPRGPWTDRGAVLYQDNVEGNQTETPHVVFNPVTALFHMYYQNKISNAVQSTYVATSPNGLTWTRVGRAISDPGGVSGNPHYGYARVYRENDVWTAHHLAGGMNFAHFGTSYSRDGLNWTTDRRSTPAQTNLTGDLKGRRLEHSQVVPFWFSGRRWCALTVSPFESGANGGGKSIRLGTYDSPRNYAPVVTVLEPGVALWASDTVRQPHVVEDGGVLYLVFAANGLDGKGAFGLMEAKA